MKLPENKAERLKFIHENKAILMTEKKSEMKKADAIMAVLPAIKTKQNKTVSGDNALQVKVVINTTNVLDSHGDVHMKGIWKKSLSEKRDLLFLQEHQMAFDKIIADGENLSAKVETLSFKELGFDLPGTTEALVFSAKIEKARNAFMLEQYKNGYVKQHSVGMQYVKLALAINDEQYPTEKAVWDKYISEVANKQAAEDAGYFWAVTEAKVIEGSAVPLGSNSFTPTIETTGAGKATPTVNNQPPDGTEQKRNLVLTYLKSF